MEIPFDVDNNITDFEPFLIDHEQYIQYIHLL